MSINLNYTLTLLKSIKYKINPFQYINSPNVDLDFSNLFKFKKIKIIILNLMKVMKITKIMKVMIMIY